MTKMTSVMIADDHRLVADGLAKMIDENTDTQVVGMCATLEETKSRISDLQPQVLLLDVAMPDGDGIDAIPDLQRISPDTKVIVLTMFAEVSVVQRALEAKADGYLFKSVGKEELNKAILSVNAGGTYLCEEAQNLLLEHGETAPTLTLREREILRLISEGHTMKEIAEQLCLGFETVHSYTKSLRQKLGCNNTATLVRAAIERHLI